MKWIVFWIAVSINPTNCETSGPFTDEYGIVHGSNTTLAIACFKTDRKNMSKEFDTLEAAQAFVDKGIKECGDKSGKNVYIHSTCDKFEIKELKPIGGHK